MGLMDIANKYQKMLENPNNRGSSSGTLKQQTPSLAEAQGVSEPKPTPTIEDADDLWIKELDKRMEAKKKLKGRINEATESNQLLSEIHEVKEMLKLVLNANLKLIKKLK